MIKTVKSINRSQVELLLKQKPIIEKNIKFFFKNNKEDNNIYVSFIFPKKVVKLSTQKNILKRKAKELIMNKKNKIVPFFGIFFLYQKENYIDKINLILKNTNLIKE